MSNVRKWSSRSQGKVASTLFFQISRKEMINWHEMWQSLQRCDCIVWQWRFYPIRKTCKNWKLTLSSLMAMYSVMRDIHDARRLPMERRWVVLYLYVTCKYSNKLTLEQWALENGLTLFWYTLYNNYFLKVSGMQPNCIIYRIFRRMHVSVFVVVITSGIIRHLLQNVHFNLDMRGRTCPQVKFLCARIQKDRPSPNFQIQARNNDASNLIGCTKLRCVGMHTDTSKHVHLNVHTQTHLNKCI